MAGRGRRPASAPDTREAILEAARELFAEKGFERTTMRAVGERAGVDPALISYWFGSKDGLLLEALTLPFEVEVVLADLDASRPGADIVRRVRPTGRAPCAAAPSRSCASGSRTTTWPGCCAR